jgi:hypothetical protein
MRSKALYFIIIFALGLFSLDCSKTRMQNSPPTTIPVLATAITTVILVPSTALSGGVITSDGGAAIMARGVCWSTTQNPTTLNSKTIDSSGTGSFTSLLTGLTANTVYYVRAYAVNRVGTAYGNEVSFKSLQLGLPMLATDTVILIGANNALSGGNISDDGGTAVTVRGVCWSINHNPTIRDSSTNDGAGVGNFISSIPSLTVSTTYYIRAYAANAGGTAYGNEVSFTTQQGTGLPKVSTKEYYSGLGWYYLTYQLYSEYGYGWRYFGIITDNGGSNITDDGVILKTISGSNISTQLIHGINNHLTFEYYPIKYPISHTVQAFATNSLGTGYGNLISF